MSTAAYLVKKASGLDVLAFLPARIGFRPVDSVVVGGLHPPNGRLGIVIRADRTVGAFTAVGELASGQAERLHFSGARAAFMVRYAPVGCEPIEDDASFWQWAGAIGERLAVIGCWDVVGEDYQEVDPGERRRFGPVYHPVDLQSTRGAATLALAGLAPKATREELAELGLAPEASRKAARAAERRATDRALALGPGRMRRWRLTGLEVWLGWQGTLLDRPDANVPPPELGRIAALLADRPGRDAVMATAFANRGDTARRLATGCDDGQIFDPYHSAGLDPERAAASLELLRKVGSHLAPRRRGPVYALGAAWHWWSGNGAAAEEWARAGVDCNDCPQLAWLILAVVARGVFPACLAALPEDLAVN
ncbi:MAG: DUF4192 domain-containing protein [Bifidobacteriaceae bacterium]|jgi:hypothetical protein|nr:DUF4192 domain-containing protein [Bifidobacteriaceae bacterium]